MDSMTWDASLCSCEGGWVAGDAVDESVSEGSGSGQKKIQSWSALTKALDEVFSDPTLSWEAKHTKILRILERVQLELVEINRFSLYSSQTSLPYTRNHVHTNAEYYTLLVLCWNPGYESKIHNHPADGCYVVPLIGSIVETRYTLHSEDNSLTALDCTTFAPGAIGEPAKVAFLADALGIVHKIGNASSVSGAVSLHLYTPPFSQCTVWPQGVSCGTQPELRSLSFFSTHGLRCLDSEEGFDVEYYI